MLRCATVITINRMAKALMITHLFCIGYTSPKLFYVYASLSSGSQISMITSTFQTTLVILSLPSYSGSSG